MAPSRREVQFLAHVAVALSRPDDRVATRHQFEVLLFEKAKLTNPIDLHVGRVVRGECHADRRLGVAQLPLQPCDLLLQSRPRRRHAAGPVEHVAGDVAAGRAVDPLGLVEERLQLGIEHRTRLRALDALLRGGERRFGLECLAVQLHGLRPLLRAFGRAGALERRRERASLGRTTDLLQPVGHLGCARTNARGSLERRLRGRVVAARKRRLRLRHCRRVRIARRARLQAREVRARGRGRRVQLQGPSIRRDGRRDVPRLLSLLAGGRFTQHGVENFRPVNACLRHRVLRVDLQHERELLLRVARASGCESLACGRSRSSITRGKRPSRPSSADATASNCFEASVNSWLVIAASPAASAERACTSFGPPQLPTSRSSSLRSRSGSGARF